ncbi:MAG: hypothetical protein M3358_09195 [Actinomycetota bacterium]|nr:hypothetical protein [Actinomycetota bacterium]
MFLGSSTNIGSATIEPEGIPWVSQNTFFWTVRVETLPLLKPVPAFWTMLFMTSARVTLPPLSPKVIAVPRKL